MIARLGLILALFSTPAYSAIPDPVTWVLHGVGGYVVARVLDKHAQATEVQGIGAATIIGIAKELHDLNFSVPDMLGWSVGAWVYYRTKDMVLCPSGEVWYYTYYADRLEDCR